MLAEERLCGVGTEIVQVAAHAQRDLLGVENLAGVVGWTMFGAAAALDAGVRLQRDNLRQILAGVQAEIFIAGERWNFGEAAAREKYRKRAQNQMQMLGVRNQREKNEERSGVRPPQQFR